MKKLLWEKLYRLNKPADFSKEGIKDILVIRRKNIGDMICAIPLLKTLRREFPNAYITVLADESNSEILEGTSFINEVIVYKKQGFSKNKYIGYRRLLNQNKRSFDLAIAAKPGFSSLLAYITSISGAKFRMGCKPEKWHPLQSCYNFPVKMPENWNSMHIVDSLLEFAKALDISNPVRDISIEPIQESRKKVKDFFKENNISPHDKIVVFNISNNRPECTWSLQRFKKLGDGLSKKYGAVCLISSTSSDMDKAINLSKQINGRSFYFPTPKVMDFAALVKDAALLVCGEGGAMHVGAAVQTQTISLWGQQQILDRWMPIGEKQFALDKGKSVDAISPEDILELIESNGIL